MSVDVQQKMLEMMQAKKIFLKKYKRAKHLFNDLVEGQKRLLEGASREKKNNETPGKINVKESIHSINEIRKILFETDQLILNSIKDYFSTDDYFFQHSFGVCYIGTIVLNRFNEFFSQYINNMLTAKFKDNLEHYRKDEITPFFYYPPEAVRTISMGYLIHDIGKIMIPDSLLNKKSGIKGVSEVSSDMRDIEAKMKEDHHGATLAMDIFTYRIKKYIGAYMAAMNGCDLIIFTAGIGERDRTAREWSVRDMEFLGVQFDKEANHEAFGKFGIISKPESKVTVMVVPTNEELEIAEQTVEVLKGHK